MVNKYVAQKLVDELNERHPEETLSLVDVPKYNEEVLTGIKMEPREDASLSKPYPIYYLNDDLSEDTFNQYLEEAEYVMFVRTCGVKIEVDDYLKPENLRIEVVNAERNENLREDYLCRKVNDLYVIPYFEVNDVDNIIGSGTIKISHNLFESLAMTEDEVFEQAYKNTADDTTLIYLSEVLQEFGFENDEFLEDEIPMLIVTNSSKFKGASPFVIADVLERVGDELNADYYILPSSRHEVIALKEREEEKLDAVLLKEMVKEVNSTVVHTEDFLSDSVYRYSRDTKTLSIVA